MRNRNVLRVCTLTMFYFHTVPGSSIWASSWMVNLNLKIMLNIFIDRARVSFYRINHLAGDSNVLNSTTLSACMGLFLY